MPYTSMISFLDNGGHTVHLMGGYNTALDYSTISRSIGKSAINIVKTTTYDNYPRMNLAKLGNIIIATMKKGISKSVDGGITWTDFTKPSFQGSNDIDGVAASQNCFLLTCNYQLYTSTDGDNWTQLDPSYKGAYYGQPLKVIYNPDVDLFTIGSTEYGMFWYINGNADGTSMYGVKNTTELQNIKEPIVKYANGRWFVMDRDYQKAVYTSTTINGTYTKVNTTPNCVYNDVIWSSSGNHWIFVGRSATGCRAVTSDTGLSESSSSILGGDSSTTMFNVTEDWCGITTAGLVGVKYSNDYGLTWGDWVVSDTSPVANAVHIDGVNKVVGTVITGDYTFFDAEGDTESGSTFKWYRGPAIDGPWTLISGANNKTYTITEADINQYLVFEVTPVTA